jgi:hypothetical protein
MMSSKEKQYRCEEYGIFLVHKMNFSNTIIRNMLEQPDIP